MILGFTKKTLAIQAADGHKKQALENDFQRFLDRSRLQQLARMPAVELDKKFMCLGEGRQFRAWRIPIDQMGAPLDFVVLKKPTPDFASKKPDYHHWLGLLSKLAGAWKETLIPPFYGFRYGEASDKEFAMVMPFGVKSNRPMSLLEQTQQQQDLERKMLQTDLWLLGRGLELADTYQVRWCRGLPLVVDLGDIRARRS